MTVCRLQARISSLQGITVCLPDCACLVLEPCALKLHGVTFKGATSFVGSCLLLVGSAGILSFPLDAMRVVVYDSLHSYFGRFCTCC